MTTPASKTARTARELVAAGVLAPERIAEIDAVAARFAVAVTPDLLALIDPTDPGDPVARQFVPAGAELDVAPEELADPIGDAAHSPVAGIVHRYPDRVLLKLTPLCPVYCRFCFRREMIGPGQPGLDAAALARALDYVRGHDAIWEVILTGGDPLVLSDRRLADVLGALHAIDHVGVIRVHTRVPVAEPARVTADLVAALRGRAAVYVLLHCNHPRELTAQARAACARLVDAGIPMLSQTVLLRGVNDDPATMTALMRALVAARIKPHYLHHGDLAPGTHGFRTTVAAGRALMAGLRGTVSGLCQPTYVLDIPGGHGKVPIGPDYLAADGDGYALIDYRGGRHRYRDAVAPDAD
jgi:lysine 2,3-aminomutase